jgi:hypothetical protein
MKKISVIGMSMVCFWAVQAFLAVNACSQFGNVSATAYNNVIEADTQAGADACAKIAAAIAALPATGGTVDARGLQGAQSCGANPFAASTKPVQLLLGGVTITTSACWSVPSNTVIAGAGRGVSTLKLANGVNSCFVISNLHSSTGDNHIAVTGLTIDGNMLNQSPTGSQRTGCVFFERVQYFWVEDNELLNCYNYGVEAFGQSQYGWVRGNRIDGTLAGSAVLFGNGPLSTDGTGAIAEAYDIWADDNWVGNTSADCLFATGSNTAGSYGTARIHFKNNTLSNCGDVSIEMGDSSRDSDAVGNMIQMPPAQALTSISRAANVVTATVAAPCNQYSAVAPFTISGVTYAGATSFNGNFTLSSVTRPAFSCTLAWAQTGENGTGGAGLIVRRGNLALLSRSGLNHSFTANVVNGNNAGQQGCEMAWGNTGDNAPRDENVNFDNVCNNTGGDAFTVVAATAGQVTQVVHKSKFDITLGNDYVISANAVGLRIQSNGYLSTGNAFGGLSFNQTNDINIRANPGNFVKLISSAGVGVSTADFNPTSMLHIRTGGNASDLTLEATVATNEGVNIKNTVQSWGFAVRNDLGQDLTIRDVTGGLDRFRFQPTGNFLLKRLKTSLGTSLTPSDFVLSAGWGNTATVTNVIGTDQGWSATITAQGTGIAPSPTMTLIFHDGSWTSSPITVTKMTGGTGAVAQLTETPTATTNVITFLGTPVSGLTYIISSVAIGR